MELSGTNPGLERALFANPGENLIVQRFSDRLSCQPLVVSLSTDTNKPAGLRYAYSNSFLPFKRKPKGFFGTVTPYSVLMMSSIDSNS